MHLLISLLIFLYVSTDWNTIYFKDFKVLIISKAGITSPQENRFVERKVKIYTPVEVLVLNFQ